MARLAATAVLLLSLLAVASCRVLEAEPETVVALSDEQGARADPAVPQEVDAAEAIPSLPTVAVGEGEGVLRLPSHRRPCRHGFLHRHLRGARHHGLSHRRGAFPGPGDARVHPAVLPDEPREAEVEVEAVAEPDPDSRPHTDVEEVEENDAKKPPRGDDDGGEENESVKAWKGEMLRRFRGHGLRFHHGHHHHHEHAEEKDDSDDQDQQEKEEGAGAMHVQHVKLFSRRFHHHHGDEEHEQEQQDKEEGAAGMPVKLFRRRFHHHNHGEEEQEDTARKHFFHHHHDSDNEVDEVEDLARRLTKAIMRRSLSRGGIRHHLHHHHHAEEGGVKKWFRGLLNMNRF